MVQFHSQNSWPAYADPSHFVRFTTASMVGWAANPDVAVIFTELVNRFNTEVEPIAGDVLDDWSWNFRPIVGMTTGYSNHASATALDLNATRHPRGVRNTFTPSQQGALHRIQSSITDAAGRPVLRLGMDYRQAPVDDMHFELNVNQVRAREAADKLRAKGTIHIQETDMQLTDFIVLSPSAAEAMTAADPGNPRKAGDKLNVAYFLLWGGPGLSRLHSEVADLRARLEALEGRGALAVTPEGTMHQVAGTVSTSSTTTHS